MKGFENATEGSTEWISISSNMDNRNNNHSASSNASATETIHTIVVSNVFQIIFIMVGIFGVISNLYVVIVIVLYKPMHKQVTNLYIANQSLLDLVVAAVFVFGNIFQDNGTPHRYDPESVWDQFLCRAWFSKMPLWAMVDSSTYSIVTLTYERYIAVLYPIWHKTKFSSSKWMIRLPIVILWLIVPQFAATYCTASSGVSAEGACTVLNVFPNLAASEVEGVFVYVVEFLLPAMLIVYGYARIAFALHGRVQASSAAEQTRIRPNGQEKIKATRVIQCSPRVKGATERECDENTKPDVWAVTIFSPDGASDPDNRGEPGRTSGKAIMAHFVVTPRMSKGSDGLTRKPTDEGDEAELRGVVEGRKRKTMNASVVGNGIASVGTTAKKIGSMAKARSNVIKTAALVGFFFIFCWSWNQTYYFLENFGYVMKGYGLSTTFRNITIVFGFVNSCVNPVIYSVNYSLFKRGSKTVFCRFIPAKTILPTNNTSQNTQ